MDTYTDSVRGKFTNCQDYVFIVYGFVTKIDIWHIRIKIEPFLQINNRNGLTSQISQSQNQLRTTGDVSDLAFIFDDLSDFVNVDRKYVAAL